MPANHDVFQCRHLGKQTDVLKRACNAGLGHLVHRARGVRLAGQLERAAVRRVQAGEHIEKSGLAGAVRPNQAIHLTAFDVDANVAEGLQATKAFRDARDFQNGFTQSHSP